MILVYMYVQGTRSRLIMTVPTGHITDSVATNPINGNLEMLLFLWSHLAEFIDGVKYIKKILMMLRWVGDLPTRF